MIPINLEMLKEFCSPEELLCPPLYACDHAVIIDFVTEESVDCQVTSPAIGPRHWLFSMLTDELETMPRPKRMLGSTWDASDARNRHSESGFWERT